MWQQNSRVIGAILLILSDNKLVFGAVHHGAHSPSAGSFTIQYKVRAERAQASLIWTKFFMYCRNVSQRQESEIDAMAENTPGKFGTNVPSYLLLLLVNYFFYKLFS